jgi:hypothetical protein
MQNLSDCQNIGTAAYVSNVRDLLDVLAMACNEVRSPPPQPWSEAIRAETTGCGQRFVVNKVISQGE